VFATTHQIGSRMKYEAIGGLDIGDTSLENRRGGIERHWDPYLGIILGSIVLLL